MVGVLFGALSASAQTPPPVPALPDTPRLTTYSLSGSNCACAVGFQLYGDGTDVDAWLQVFIGSAPYLSTDAMHGWAITSPTGSIGAIQRPITNAILTFAMPQTGVVTIVGDRRPRRTSQFPENRGVAARDFNQVITDLVATEREVWDKFGRTIIAPGNEALNPLPPAAARAGQALIFDGGGQPTVASATAVPITASLIELPNMAPLPTIDLQTIVPVNGFYASGSGAVFQNCPLTGCVAGNHEQAALYLKATAVKDKSIAEYMAVFDCNLNSGRTGVAVGISDNKVCFFNSATTGANAGGGTWVQANDLVIGAGDTGTFKVNTEIDISNLSAGCTPGTMHDCWGLIVGGIINNPVTSYIAVSDFGQTPMNKGAHFAYLVLGPNTAIDTDFEDSGGASNGFCSGCLQATSHAIASFRDRSTAPQGLSLEGVYSVQAISAPGFSVNGVPAPGQIGVLSTSPSPVGGTMAIGLSNVVTFGIYMSNGNPTVAAANGSIDLDTSGKLWVRTGGTWTQVTVP